MKKTKYFIRETWRVSGCIEKYDEETNPCSNTVDSLRMIKAWIKNWIETWKENAVENDYKFLGFKTDYKTFAKCRIKTGELFGDSLIDTFSLKVVKK